jgi:hypothetical protein
MHGLRSGAPSSDRRIKNQRPDAMNSTRLQWRSQCNATVHRLESVDCAYAAELSTVHLTAQIARHQTVHR